MKIKDKEIVFALTNSSYAFKRTISEMEKIIKQGGKIIPIMSIDAYKTDTKFGTAADFVNKIENITKRKIIYTEREAEEEEGDILVICPCSGNHIAKLAASIYDTPVLTSAKLHLRNNKPVLLGIATKDALSTNAENIGKLLNRKNIFFIPVLQNNPITKPYSISFSPKYIIESIEYTLEYKQIQPLLL